MKKIILICIITTIAGMTAAFATAPAWWTDSTNGTAIIDGNATANNYAPLNIGQLKNVASKAKTYFDNNLSGGAGTDINNMVANFTANSTIDYQVANLGQLKAVAKPFYDRLIGIGYNTNANLIAQGFPGNWTGNYAWDPGTSTAVNYEPANVGQLKMVFSFDVAQDTDGDGIYDYLELAFAGTNPGSNDTDGDTSHDGSDVFPLDPAFAAIPANTATNVSGPVITLTAPANAVAH